MYGAYGNLGHGRSVYTNEDILHEMQRNGTATGAGMAPTTQFNYGSYGVHPQSADAYPASWTKAQGFSGHASTAMPSGSQGLQFDPSSMYRHSQQHGNDYADYDPRAFLPPELMEDAVSFERREGSVVSERLVETQQHFIAGVPRNMFHSEDAQDRAAVRAVIDRVAADGVAVAGVRPLFMMEKIVEVPHVITREYDKYVPRPEVVERLVEVPKTEIKEVTVNLPPRVQYREQIVEVPEVVVEERVVHVPKREIQERLIEVPKVRFVERIVYEDVIEYREVPVDKIVEVPEIEYVVKEVEHLVPQTYIQEYYVDKYKETPITQVQEVERVEYVPVVVPPGYVAPPPASMPMMPPAMPPSMVVSQAPALELGGMPTPPMPTMQPYLASLQPAAAMPPPASQPVLAAPPTPPTPPGAAAAAPASLAGLPVGSSFLVPKGTLPRGRMPTSQAELALGSMRSFAPQQAPALPPSMSFGMHPQSMPFGSQLGVA